MFICTFYHTPVAFCDRGIVFYITKGVSLMRHPLFTFHQVHGNCIERGKKSKVFLHVGNANQVSIGFPTWRSKWAQN